MSKKMKNALFVLSSLAILTALTLILGTMGMDEIRDYQIPSIDLPSKQDGIYHGTLARTRWGLSVEVSVKNHIITEIKITDRKSSNITESLINELSDQLINRSTPDFDAVSGATMTTKGYLIAVAEALKGGSYTP